MSKAGARATKTRRTLAGAVLASLVLVVNGCAGCNACTAGRSVNGAIGWLVYWNAPKCEPRMDCIGISKCPPGEEPACKSVGQIGSEYRMICGCTALHFVAAPDGGGRPIVEACANTRGKGPSICGIWDFDRQVILGEDGGVIWDNDGGTLRNWDVSLD